MEIRIPLVGQITASGSAYECLAYGYMESICPTETMTSVIPVSVLKILAVTYLMLRQQHRQLLAIPVSVF